MSTQNSPAPSDDDREALARVDDAIKRVPKLGGADAIYEAELLDVLRCARVALARLSPVPQPEDVTKLTGRNPSQLLSPSVRGVLEGAEP